MPDNPREIDVPLLPPPHLREFVGIGDYVTIGNRFLTWFVTLGGLQPDEHVLDVGCGSGRMAVPLTQFLAASARYEGFDVAPEAITWCQTAITACYPNFHFQVADIHNTEYNPDGAQQGEEYQFPYQDGAFSFVFLTSVFTHLRLPVVDRYLAEIARVLQPGGRCFATFFLLNDTSRVSIAEKRSVPVFPFPLPEGYTINPDVPEAALCLDEVQVREVYRKHSLHISAPISYGNWTGRRDFVDYQDIVLATKQS